jgi:hypothetical protein
MLSTCPHLLWAVHCTEQATEASIQRQGELELCFSQGETSVKHNAHLGAQTCTMTPGRVVIYKELMLRYKIGATGDNKQSTEMYVTMRCHDTVQHGMVGRFLNNCVMRHSKIYIQNLGPADSWPHHRRRRVQLVRGRRLLD